MTPTRWISYCGLALVATTLVSCGKHGSDEEGEAGNHASPLVAVRTAAIVVGDAVQTLSATGRTDVLRREKVYSPVAGVITSLEVLEGSSVRAGQVVATIMTKESQAAIAGAEALLRAAQTESQKVEAERALQLARAAQNSVAVTVRTGGVVGTRNVNRGEIVAENTELMTLLDPLSVVFVAEIPMVEIDRIHRGTTARIHLTTEPDRPLAGVVDAVLPQGDAQAQTVRVRLQLSGKAQTLARRPDVGGTVDLVIGVKKNALLVPKRALLRDDETNTYTIVIMTPDSISLAVPVTVGAMEDSTVEVISPVLKSGMQVITEGHYHLADSTRVTVYTKADR